MVTRLDVVAPPEDRLTPWEWVHRNLLAGWWNTALTAITVGGLTLPVFSIVGWAFAAHWGVVVDNPRLWLVGLTPVELARRAYWAGGLVVAAALLTLVGTRVRVPAQRLVGLWVGILVAVIWVMAPVRLDQIGGLYLTVLLAASAIALSFPIGVLVGLGRVSQLPVIRGFAATYIEVIRGIPLVAVFLWFSVFVTLVSGDALSRVERAIIAMTVFTSAYVGEIVRAGILSVPRGQVEAARALGLSSIQTMRSIVLPQAVKNMIPALVGQFISLFKDTTLTVIIGLTDLVGIGRALLAITAYLHDVREVYVFLLIVFFVFSSTMSYGSRLLERRLGLGER
jgi:general L-amino acid transport system permease protein